MKMREYTLGLLAVAVLACVVNDAVAAKKNDDVGEVSITLSERSGLTGVLDMARSGTLGLAASLGLGFDQQPLRSTVRQTAVPAAGRTSADRLAASSGSELAPPPSVFAFAPAIPNPFDRETMLSFDLPSASRVRIETYDVRGRVVKGAQSEDLGPGRYQRRWNGVDDGGRTLPPGIYLVRIHASAADGGRAVQAVRKMLMLR